MYFLCPEVGGDDPMISMPHMGKRLWGDDVFQL